MGTKRGGKAAGKWCLVLRRRVGGRRGREARGKGVDGGRGPGSKEREGIARGHRRRRGGEV